MRRPPSPFLVAFVGVFALVGGCNTAPTATVPVTADPIDPQTVSGKPGEVGGEVKNSAPTVSAFDQSATTGENRGGFAVVFSGTVFDPNTERQIAKLTATGTGPANSTSARDVTLNDANADSEPAAFGSDGWKVWGGAKEDGTLHYAYRHEFAAFAPTGDYSFTLRVEDRSGADAGSSARTVKLTPFSDITVSSTPVSATGEDLPRENWGQWSAEAGATGVESTNYLKLVNTGDAPRGKIVIDFAPSFVGSDDANFTIPTANNLAFAWFEDTSPARTAPNEGQYDFLPTNADGTVTVEFTGKGNVIYVTYRVLQMPTVLPIQSYGISFTATEL